jgi:hypothetical protein
MAKAGPVYVPTQEEIADQCKRMREENARKMATSAGSKKRKESKRS